MQPMRMLSMQSWGGQFFPCWGRREVFFPPCSQCVPMGSPKFLSLFLKSFPKAPQFYPIWFCWKFNSHVYKLKMWAQWSTFVSVFSKQGSYEMLLLRRVPQWSKKIGDGPINMAPSKSKKERRCEHIHELINMNHTYPHIHKSGDL
jgi:hypothetical protein